MTNIEQGQLDLFIASASDVSPKEQQDLMARSWFSLAKQKRVEPIVHEFGDNWVKITGDPKLGIATIFDNDVIIFCIAQYMHSLNKKKKTHRKVHFTGYQYYKFVGKKRFGGKGYTDLWKSLERLHHTFVETNIRLDKGNRHHSFTWLSSIKQLHDGDRHRGYEIELPEWLYQSIVNDKLVLTLDDGYFDIRGGLERWLYLFARKSSGWQTGGWAESIELLYQKSGSKSSFTEFKRQLKKIINKKSILGYKVNELSSQRQKAIHFLRDNELIDLVSKNRKRRGATKWR